jgi:hypothetical protein
MTSSKKLSTRSDGERERAKHIISRLRGCIDGLEIGLRDYSAPIGLEAGEAITQTSIELDAYMRAEQDQKQLLKIKQASKDFIEVYERISDDNNWGSLGDVEDQLKEELIK